jgi:hypothetical protein
VHNTKSLVPWAVQVPVGTSVRVLDKVFARVAQLKLPYLQEQAASEGGEPEHWLHVPEPAIDHDVSADAADLAARFDTLRQLQLGLGAAREIPLTVDKYVTLHRPEDRNAQRR